MNCSRWYADEPRKMLPVFVDQLLVSGTPMDAGRKPQQFCCTAIEFLRIIVRSASQGRMRPQFETAGLVLT